MSPIFKIKKHSASFENYGFSKKESDRFLNYVQKIKKLKSGQLYKLNIEVKNSNLKRNKKKGIF